MNKITTVIFDLDGTLLDTLEDLKNSVNYALTLNGHSEISLDDTRRYVGNGAKLLISRATPMGEDNPDYPKIFEAFTKHYSAHSLDCTKPYEGVTDMLATLKEKGYRCAIVSNKGDSAVKALSKHFFDTLIDTAYGESDKIKKKPAPDTVFAVMSELGVGRDECVYVGDSDVDIMTANNAGIPCISVTWGFRDRDFLVRNGGKTFIDTPNDILRLI